MSGHRVCPWWLGYLLISPIRRFAYNPAKILAPYVREGMTVLEPGPGMGFFTLDLARMVGESGRVVVVDVQQKMLDKLKNRLAKKGLERRVETRLVKADSMGIGDLAGKVDFVLAFAMVHEVPSSGAFFREAAQTMKSGAVLLLAEPKGHVKAEHFDAELRDAAASGLTVSDRPKIRHDLTALLKR